MNNTYWSNAIAHTERCSLSLESTIIPSIPRKW